MQKGKLPSGKALIEVIRGPEGPCLCIGDHDGGHRLAGPKPWGGGSTTHSFEVDASEIIAEATYCDENYSGKAIFTVIAGDDGAFLSIGSASRGYRLAGAYPSGVYRTAHTFKVNAQELIREAKPFLAF